MKARCGTRRRCAPNLATMTRLQKLSLDEMDPTLRARTRADERTPLELGLMRIIGQRPDLAEGLMAFTGGLKRNGTLPRRLIELVRLRVAFFNQCRSCMAIRYDDALADGLTEDLVCSLEKPAEAADLTDAEKAAIRYGELFATNHLAIDDSVYDELRRHFTEPEIIELCLNVSLFVGIGRLAATWHMIEELPDAFQAPEGARLTPWGNESIVVH